MISPQAFDGFCLLYPIVTGVFYSAPARNPRWRSPSFSRPMGYNSSGRSSWRCAKLMLGGGLMDGDGWRCICSLFFLCVHCVHNKKLLIIDNIEHRGVWYFKFDSNRGVWYFKLNSHCVFLKRVIVFALRLAKIYSRAYHVASPRTTGQILQSDIDPRLNATCSRPLPLLVSA